MTEPRYRELMIPQCIEAPLRRALQDANERLADVNQDVVNVENQFTTSPGPTYLNGQPASYYLNLANHTGTMPLASIPIFFRRGTLAGTLTRDGTQTLNDFTSGTVTVHGYFVKTGYRAKSGSRCGAIYDIQTTTWIALVDDDCLEVVP